MKFTHPLARQALQSRLKNKPISNGGCCIDSFLYGQIIDRCTDRRLVRQGEQVHARLFLLSATANNFLASKLIRFYGKTHQLSAAGNVFDQIPKKNTYNFNTLLITYSVHSLHNDTLALFSKCLSQKDEFLNLRDLKPDAQTLSCVLKSVSEVAVDGPLSTRIIHCCVIKYGLDFDAFVGNGLVTCYSRCGDVVSARAFFDNMSGRDLVSWNAIISGMVQNNQYDMVLDLVRQMQICSVQPNMFTLSSILPTILFVSHLKGLKEIHAYAIRRNSEWDIYVVSSMIAAYAKLGFLSAAKRIFDLADNRSVVWTAIISGYASHGDAKATLSLFDEMLNSRTKPNAVTFTAVLSACAHAGLIDEACKLFDEVLPKYEIGLLANHYACMVACLTRAGRLLEAVEFVQKMPIEPTGPVWGALLNGASECDDIELAKFVCDSLFKLEPQNPTNYIILANLYSKTGRWDEAEKVRGKMTNIGFKKVAGSSWLEGSTD